MRPLQASSAPRRLALASARTAGALTYLVTPDHTATARNILGQEGFLAVELSVVLDETRDEFLRRAHEHLNFYTGLDNYRSSWRRLGFDDTDFIRGGSERLCDAIVVHGDADEIARHVAAHFDAGADHVCLQVVGSTMEEAPVRQWEALGAVLGGR
jgi:probable F420-dependent oxidoreductase